MSALERRSREVQEDGRERAALERPSREVQEDGRDRAAFERPSREVQEDGRDRAAFELSVIGGPWRRRLARRRGWLDDLAWREPLPDDDDARLAWTRTAFSEYASAAAFAEIAAALLAAGAPIDLIAAAGDFVVDEIVHTEAAARIAAALGGAVALDVDLTRLVRPPLALPTSDAAASASRSDPALLRAAALVVRTSCVGEALTVPMLKLARRTAGSPLIAAALARIVGDEAGHAQLGWWFLDWAAPRLDDAARAALSHSAGDAIRAFAPLLGGSCRRSLLGAVACDAYDATLLAALPRAVIEPLALRGIAIPAADLAALEAGSARA